MNIVMPTQGARLFLEMSLGVRPASALTVRLFINDREPLDDDTEADYAEASGSGYAPHVLNAEDWTVSELGRGLARAIAPLHRFSFTEPLGDAARPDSVFGYFVTNADGQLLYAERLEEPYTPGDWLDVTAVLKFGPQDEGIAR